MLDKKPRYALVEGISAAGSVIMSHQAKHTDSQDLLADLRKKKNLDRILYAKNFYKVPKLLGETLFDEDTEG